MLYLVNEGGGGECIELMELLCSTHVLFIQLSSQVCGSTGRVGPSVHVCAPAAFSLEGLTVTSE